MMLRILVVVGLMIMVSLSAEAFPDRVGTWDAGLEIGAFLPNDQDVDDAFYIGGNVSYGISENFGVGAEVGWAEADVDLISNTGAAKSDAGEVSIVPLLADFYYRAPSYQEKMMFYGVLGLGLAFVNGDEGSTFTNSSSSLDGDTGFAVKIGGGFDAVLDAQEKWTGNVSIGYTFVSEEVEAHNSAGTKVDEADLDYFLITAGMRYIF